MNSIKPLGISYLAILVTYLIADFIWLGIIARSDYTNSIGHLMREGQVIWPWVAFYLVYSACILRIALFNGAPRTFARVFVNAFVLGLASYGAYNLTNYAILQDWPLSITFKDWVWGTSITTFSALVGFTVLAWLNRKSAKKDENA
jgi:uncharacterized membrane protein